MLTSEAVVTCEAIVAAILAVNPGMSFYDIRLKCPSALQHDCYDFSVADSFLAMDWVKRQINVEDRDWYDREAEMATSDVLDTLISYRDDIPPALEAGVRVLVYK